MAAEPLQSKTTALGRLLKQFGSWLDEPFLRAYRRKKGVVPGSRPGTVVCSMVCRGWKSLLGSGRVPNDGVAR